MKTVTQIVLILYIILSCSFMSLTFAQNKFDLVSYTTDDTCKIEAAFFDAGTEKAVIFAHGAIFNKESWYFLAEKFQTIGISSLPIDFRGYGNSVNKNQSQKYYDISGAVQYLKNKGIKEINLIGGSMGGAAVLQALDHSSDPLISKVVLLAPAGGPAIKSNTIKKLIIVSENEGLYNRVKTIFNESAEPKILKEFQGNTHAQHLFKTDNSEELIKLIIDFIND